MIQYSPDKEDAHIWQVALSEQSRTLPDATLAKWQKNPKLADHPPASPIHRSGSLLLPGEAINKITGKPEVRR